MSEWKYLLSKAKYLLGSRDTKLTAYEVQLIKDRSIPSLTDAQYELVRDEESEQSTREFILGLSKEFDDGPEPRRDEKFAVAKDG